MPADLVIVLGPSLSLAGLAYLIVTWPRIGNVSAANQRLIDLTYKTNQAKLHDAQRWATESDIEKFYAIFEARWAATRRNYLRSSFVWCPWKSIAKAEALAAQKIREVSNA